MNWLELIATVFGTAVAFVSLVKFAIDFYRAVKHGTDFTKWFSYGRKVKGLKYLSIFQKRSALGLRNEVSNSVRHQLTREIAKDVIHSYSVDRRGSRFSRSSRDQLGLMLSLLCLFGLIIAIGVLRNIASGTPATQKFIDSVTVVLSFWIAVVLCMLALQVIVLFWRLVNDCKSTSELIRFQVVQVPLESIPYCVENGKDYVFLDATIRERYQVPFMGTADRVQMLLDHGVAVGEVATLENSEAKQVKSSDYEDVAGKLVDSFLSKTSEDGNQPVYFVFSQAGITAVLVTQLLRRKGLRAFYIGATNGYESEVRETIREVRILRDSGLI